MLPKLPPAPRMRNWLLKFENPNGQNVWFTVYCTFDEIEPIAAAITKRTGHRFRYDQTEL